MNLSAEQILQTRFVRAHLAFIKFAAKFINSEYMVQFTYLENFIKTAFLVLITCLMLVCLFIISLEIFKMTFTFQLLVVLTISSALFYVLLQLIGSFLFWGSTMHVFLLNNLGVDILTDSFDTELFVHTDDADVLSSDREDCKKKQ